MAHDLENELYSILEEQGNLLPRFSDGRIDFTHAPFAPVVTIFVQFENKILLVKRSDKVTAYKNTWGTIGGYLDEIRPVSEKVLEELEEELGITESTILKMYFSNVLESHDISIQRRWFVYPVLVQLKTKPEIVLDWEHTEYKWIMPQTLSEYEVIPETLDCWTALQTKI